MEVAASDRERSAPASGAPTTQAAEGLQAFGYELIRDNAQLLEDGNVVVSPASIGAAFAMARLGARGETAEQIDAVLHFPTSGLGDAYNSLTRDWTDAPASKDAPEVSIANSAFVQRDFELQADYLHALATDFGVGMRTVDFPSGQAAAEINEWVRRETRDRIDRLFNYLDPDTRLVLANAVYLKAVWTEQFRTALTSPEPFRRSDGSVVRPEMMHAESSAEFEYVATSEWSAVRLPYVGGELAMWVFLPAAADGDPVPLLDPAILATAIEQAQEQPVDLSLPKWDFQSDLPLRDALVTLGMETPFSDFADFSAMAAEPLKIDQVQHRADITVDEAGTEAAAVTGVSIVPVSAPARPDVVMTVDHPFAFVVMHEPSGAPLFEGIVGDPTATQ